MSPQRISEGQSETLTGVRWCGVAQTAILEAKLNAARGQHWSAQRAVPENGGTPLLAGRTSHGADRHSRLFLASDESAVQFAFALLQGKWKIRILRLLQYGPLRLGEVRRNLPQASKKVLTQHLRQMEKDGLIARTDLSGKVPHVEYSLLAPLGLATLNLIQTLAEWGAQHSPRSLGSEPIQLLPDERVLGSGNPNLPHAREPQGVAAADALGTDLCAVTE